MRCLSSIGLGLLACVAVAGAPRPVAAQCPTRPSWPTGAWPRQVEATRANRAGEIAELDKLAFTLVGKDEERKGTRTDAVVVIKNGAVVYERYARGFKPEMRHYSWSVSKAFTNALAGVAVAQNAVRIDDSICRHDPTLPKTSCEITIKNLLEFASGLDWTEVYEDKSNQTSSVLAMLYGVGRRDMARFIAGHRRRDPPGTSFMYSTGDSTLLAGVIHRAMIRSGRGEAWPWELLFEPVGMGNVTFQRDPTGTPVGGSSVWATPEDLARFGFLLLNDGCWEGQRHLPTGWVRLSTTPSPPFRTKPLGIDGSGVAGWQLWLNVAVPEQKVLKPWPSAPGDTFAARGHWGQSVTVIPSLDLVIVRTADDREKGFDFDRFLSLCIAVAR